MIWLNTRLPNISGPINSNTNVTDIQADLYQPIQSNYNILGAVDAFM